mmetsp:Transcript_10908/g.10540  ORF Transcript_10908/g.10540 Transcript_10908/m.10540 type:complete len:337 (-) Transcript_10908:917-1927(-)
MGDSENISSSLSSFFRWILFFKYLFFPSILLSTPLFPPSLSSSSSSFNLLVVSCLLLPLPSPSLLPPLPPLIPCLSPSSSLSLNITGWLLSLLLLLTVGLSLLLLLTASPLVGSSSSLWSISDVRFSSLTLLVTSVTFRLFPMAMRPGSPAIISKTLLVPLNRLNCSRKIASSSSVHLAGPFLAAFSLLSPPLSFSLLSPPLFLLLLPPSVLCLSCPSVLCLLSCLLLLSLPFFPFLEPASNRLSSESSESSASPLFSLSLLDPFPPSLSTASFFPPPLSLSPSSLLSDSEDRRVSSLSLLFFPLDLPLFFSLFLSLIALFLSLRMDSLVILSALE